MLTFVECKRYCDSRLKREVYPQAINYASDLQNQLIHYDSNSFNNRIDALIHTSKSTDYTSFDDVINKLSKDQLLEGKNKKEWKRQFTERLEYNIKNGICRIILLCSPAPNNAFNFRAIRNLMRLMTFSETSSSNYDIMIMDMREENNNYVSRLIWRRYIALPQIPLVADSMRDNTAAIEKIKDKEEYMNSVFKSKLDELMAYLSENDFIVVENTAGYAIKDESTKASIYTTIKILDNGWMIIRHQIRPPEMLYYSVENGEEIEALSDLRFEIKSKSSSKGSGKLFDIEIYPGESTDMNVLYNAIVHLAKSDT